MHFNRDMFTGSNLNIDYNKLRNDQLKRAKFNIRENATIKRGENQVQTGDFHSKGRYKKAHSKRRFYRNNIRQRKGSHAKNHPPT